MFPASCDERDPGGRRPCRAVDPLQRRRPFFPAQDKTFRSVCRRDPLDAQGLVFVPSASISTTHRPGAHGGDLKEVTPWVSMAVSRRWVSLSTAMRVRVMGDFFAITVSGCAFRRVCHAAPQRR